MALTSGIQSSTRSDSDSDGEPTETRALARRRRRMAKKKTADENKLYEAEAAKGQQSRRRKKKDKNKERNEEEADPYESDPGESYRQHCMRVEGLNTRSCFRMPKLRMSRAGNTALNEAVSRTTSPPSPLNSEMEDLLCQVPPSLPPDMTRVRYSLRSSIGDGSSEQPTGPTIMERRQLRPNGVKLNVSHWSDCGSRPYMEDR